MIAGEPMSWQLPGNLARMCDESRCPRSQEGFGAAIWDDEDPTLSVP